VTRPPTSMTSWLTRHLDFPVLTLAVCKGPPAARSGPMGSNASWTRARMDRACPAGRVDPRVAVHAALQRPEWRVDDAAPAFGLNPIPAPLPPLAGHQPDRMVLICPKDGLFHRASPRFRLRRSSVPTIIPHRSRDSEAASPPGLAGGGLPVDAVAPRCGALTPLFPGPRPA